MVIYKPEIPQNTGTLLRLAACLGITIHIIEPCGFVLNDRRLRRSGMDYMDTARITRYASWEDFYHAQQKSRCILLTPHTTQSYIDFHFQKDDFLMVGQESSGVPETIMNSVNAKVCIPMKENMRSLNVAVAAAMVIGEALRQTNQFPLSNFIMHPLS